MRSDEDWLLAIKHLLCLNSSLMFRPYWVFIRLLYIYTECPRRNVPDFGRVFLMLKYTDITQNTYVQS